MYPANTTSESTEDQFQDDDPATTPRCATEQADPPHQITVLHAFHSYLPLTENWAFNLISATPKATRIVAAQTLLHNNFFDPETTYLPAPLSGPLPNPNRSALISIYNRAYSYSQKHYPEFLAKLGLDIDLIHSHFGHVGYFYRKLRTLLDKPLVVSFYGQDYEHLPFIEPSWIPKYRELFSTADRFICEGTHGAETLARIGCPEIKISINRLGVLPNRIPRQVRNKPPGQLNLVQRAAITEKKGHEDALEAFALALRHCPNMTLTFAGKARQPKDRAILDNLRRRVSEKCIANRVTFLEGIDYAQLYDFLANYDAFIHPSVHTKERDCEGGAPVVLLDAQATGMPVIATKHCDIPAEVIQGHTGFLREEHDIAGLAQDIQTLYEMDQDDYQAFGDRARQHVFSHYDIEQNAINLRNIYDDVISAYGH